MAQQRKQELAHVLLTELLAYQFAMPVRWSDTQTFLFDHQKVERLIEVGPSSTLLGMAKKTIGQFNLQSDAANAIERSFLATSANYDEICYESSVRTSSPGHRESRKTVSDDVVVVQGPEPPAAPAIHTPADSRPLPPVKIRSSAMIPDVPVSALQLTQALVSGSLRRPFSAINTSDTIKALSGGRSTIQNEIMGDMLREFGPLVDDAENTAVGELASTIQKTHDGKIGSCLRTRLEKMVASKMPGSFSLVSIRAHLQHEWGLDSGRQDTVLLLALCEQPSVRFRETAEAESFLDGIAQKYLDSVGLTRPVKGESPAGDAQIAVLDSKAGEQIRSELHALKTKVASLLLSSNESNGTINSLPKQISSIGGDLDVLDVYETEFGHDFCNGIRPIFKAEQQRVYDSVWNWAHVDLLTLYYRFIKTQHVASEPSQEDLVDMERVLRGRDGQRLQNVKKHLSSRISSRSGSVPEKTMEFLQPSYERAHLESHEEQYDGIGSETDDYESSSTPDFSSSSSSGLPAGEDSTENITLRSSCNSTRLLRILQRIGSSWVPHDELTGLLNNDLPIPTGGFVGKHVLITGAGPNSIGISILPLLLRAGARVLVTTSRPMPDASPVYQQIFTSHGGNGAQLVVVPCNQGSKQDIQKLIDHIYDPANGLGWDLDFILPMAALSESGREIDNIDAKSELAHRAMLVNTLRLLGAVKQAKEIKGSSTRPAQVLLPLSPNKGTFGNDGLYSESKLGLMAILNKWSSESWSDYLALYGVVIGWTRGTGLMAANDDVAKGIEELDIKTFSVQEMADKIVKLMSTPFVSACQDQCLMADLSGGMHSDPALAASLAEIRFKMRQSEEIQRAVSLSTALDMDAVRGRHIRPSAPSSGLQQTVPLVNLELGFPSLPDYSAEIQPLNSTLNGMVDLESVVVVVGFAEIGPWGNSRTRWEMEVNGELSLQGCIELAWMVGMIRHNPDPSPSGEGVIFEWIDVASGSPVRESDVKRKYEKTILDHAGIRLIEPGPLDHSSRDQNQFLQEVIIQDDLPPFTSSHDAAQDFVREHGDYAQIKPIPGTDQYSVRLRKGAIIMIPKATVYDRIVGGQLPSGWDPTVYGLPQDICESIDRCTLMTLVCTAEALLSAGITDAYELFKTIDVTELANCVGSGMGGAYSLQKLYRERYLDREVQSDILAETFINTTGAWLNMLLLSSNGPTRTPVGACATALESLNQGYDLITSGTAKVCIVGGFDGITQATSAEFANMGATNNTAADMKRGRSPREASRPCASSRAGFVESEGCGIQVITSAKVALDLGLPIRSVVAHVSTASDGVGRSVPAPGKGIMANVRETRCGGPPSPLLNIDYRKQMLHYALESLRGQRSLFAASKIEDSSFLIEAELAMQREEREARRRFGNAFWTHDRRISPLRGALAVWGLNADDIGVVSLHGTSTELNEKNEVEVLHRQLDQLGRSAGNAALVVCQKYLTGHPKGAAAAWMLNGCCQILETGVVPGNRNADNIDAAFEKWHHLVFPNQSIPLDEVKAFSVTSFGFGQKGAQALGVHPKYLLATLSKEQFDNYSSVRQKRYWKAKQYFQNMFYGGRLIVLKDKPPVMT
ncbi:putative beta-ketoacyl-[acyl-carrier-protein] synthase I [Seiridium cardinale]